MLLYIIANGNNVDGSKRRGGINKTLCGFHDAFWARNSFHVIVCNLKEKLKDANKAKAAREIR